MVTFQCSPGLVPSQQMISVCMANGRWTPDPAELVCRGKPGGIVQVALHLVTIVATAHIFYDWEWLHPTSVCMCVLVTFKNMGNDVVMIEWKNETKTLYHYYELTTLLILVGLTFSWVDICPYYILCGCGFICLQQIKTCISTHSCFILVLLRTYCQNIVLLDRESNI